MIYFSTKHQTNVRVIHWRNDSKIQCQCIITGMFGWCAKDELSFKRPANAPYWMQAVIC